MIKIIQVKRDMGQVILTIEYGMTSGNEVIDVDAEQIVDRLKNLRTLLGRKPTQNEAREIVVALINEIRAGREPFVEIVPWENFIGVDLEV